MHQEEPLPPETKQRVLEGAAFVFSEDGYEGASMARIAAQAGVSKGTLYNYFDSKEALFVTYIEDSCALKLARIFDGVTETDDIAHSLHLLAERALTLMLSKEGIGMYRLVVSIAPKFPELAETFFAAGAERAISYMRAFLVRADAAGQLQVPDPQFAAEQFFALCQTKVCLRRRLNMAEDPPEVLERVVAGAVEMFLRSYGPRS
jgi:AcrR family transcriptional regulator